MEGEDERQAHQDDNDLRGEKDGVGKRAGFPRREGRQCRDRAIELDQLGEGAKGEDREEGRADDGMNREAVTVSVARADLHL